MSTRPLGPITLLALGVNGIVGVGIFVAPPLVARAVPGPRGALIYLVVAVACLPVALTYARLARALPGDGGPCLYADHAFGRRVSRAIGALAWVSALFSASAVTRALSDLVARAIGFPSASPFLACALVALLAIANVRGLRLSAIAWTVLTVLKIAPLMVLAMIGAVRTTSTVSPGPRSALGPALLSVLFAMQGFEIVSLPAGQARNAARDVPRATVGALVLAGTLYAAVHLACVRALPDLQRVEGAIPKAAAALAGVRLSNAIGLGVAASIAGITVGMHAMTPRYLMAIGGKALSGSVETSWKAIAASAILIAPLSAAGGVAQLVDLSSVSVLAQFAVTAGSLAVLSLRREAGLRRGSAWPVPLVLAVVAVLLSQAPWRELAFAAGLSAVAAIVAARKADA